MKPYLFYWKAAPVRILMIICTMCAWLGIALVTLWYYIPENYVPDDATVARISQPDWCGTPKCKAIVDDVLQRVNRI
jgi:hypothetical protein